MPAASRHSSRQPTDTPPATASRSAAAHALKAAAHDAYRDSVAAGAPLTGTALGEIFDRSPAWGTARIREVRDTDIGRGQNTAPRHPGPNGRSNGNTPLPIDNTPHTPAATRTNGHDDAAETPLPIGSSDRSSLGDARLPISSNRATAVGLNGHPALPIGNGTGSQQMSIGSTSSTEEKHVTGGGPPHPGPVPASPAAGAAFGRPVTRQRPRAINRRPEVPTSLVVVMVVAVVTVAVVTIVTSYVHTRDLAKLAGMGWLAKILPAAVDGLVVAGSASLMVDRRIRGRNYHGHPLAWAAVVIGLISSLAANVVAVDPTLIDMRVVRWVIAGYAPLALGISGHLLLRVLGERRARPLPMDANDVAHIISTYDAIVRSNTTDDHDPVRAVADDTDGEVTWEVIQTASDLGYDLNEPDLDTLFAATEEYRARLAAEVASRQVTRPTATADPPARSAAQQHN